jgi:NAD(P)-dependent dehydrogenase (short-subunit alcohol dehydrogenase family)
LGSLDGRVIVVTGAGRGIGREHALLLAAEGARLVVNDLGGDVSGSGSSVSLAEELAAEIRATGGEAVADTSDVADWDAARRLVQTALDTYGDLHGLVNNAGVLRDRALANLSEEEWEIVVRVNLTGHVAPTRWAATWWREQAKAGREIRASVVNTSSESGVFGNAGQSNYVAAKSAVASLTQVWAKELSRYGVRVNAILPRARTRLTENDAIRPREGRFDLWHPANVSPFVAYLAGEGCPLTGETFLVAGSVVQRVRPWELDSAWKLQTSGRWTVEDLDKAVADAGLPSTERDTGLIR